MVVKSYVNRKLTIGLFFGGRSTEHEISVITALQAYENFDKEKYEIIPIFISKSGEFYTSSELLDLKNFKDIKSLLLSSTKVTFVTNNGKGGLLLLSLFKKFLSLDVAFPALHGSFGEDGSLQGVFETYKIPYVGFSVLGSAVGIDKLASKLFFQALGLPIAKYVAIKRADWQQNQKKWLKIIRDNLSWPMFIKPATIGSSIGVNMAINLDQLQFNIEVAAIYADKILVEEAFQNTVEVNCSALGYKNPQASVCEQPIPTAGILSFEDKYKRGAGKGSKSRGMASLSRIIPAPIGTSLTKQIQQTTIKIFKALDGCGVARVDYFVDPKKEEFWINEINTIPGSLSFYLWKPKGISYKKLLDRLITYALEKAEDQQQTQYTFEPGLLTQMASQAGVNK